MNTLHLNTVPQHQNGLSRYSTKMRVKDVFFSKIAGCRPSISCNFLLGIFQIFWPQLQKRNSVKERFDKHVFLHLTITVLVLIKKFDVFYHTLGPWFTIRLPFSDSSGKKFMRKKSRTINYSMSSEFKVFRKNPNAEKIDFASIFLKKMISFKKWMQNLFFLPFPLV